MGAAGEQPALEAARNVAERAAAELGLEVVEISLKGSGKGALLRIDIDRAGPAPVGIEECRKMSRAMSEMLDALDPIQHGYTLEVSSPGIDRLIVTDADVRRNTGRKVVAQTSAAVAGKREFRGILVGIDGDDTILRDGDSEVRIARQSIVQMRQDPGF